MRFIDMTPPKKESQKLWDALVGKPLIIRFVYESIHGPTPHMGWVPMLCQLIREFNETCGK